jgi:PEP-CTERM motif-containing protein
MSIRRWWIAVTLLGAFILLTARANALPISDTVSFFAANQPIPGFAFSFPEGANGTDPGTATFALANPIVIELLGPAGEISDVLTISAISGTFASDNDSPGGPPDSGESATAFDVQVQSDSDPTASGGTSDIMSLFSAGSLLVSAPFLEGDPESLGFSSGLFVPLFEPGTSIVSDTLTISITGSFVSDGDPSTLGDSQSGAFQFDEAQFTQAPGSLFSVRVASDSTVPEPATLALLGMGLAGLSFTRRRKRD